MELKHYFAILRRWGWIMLLCTVLAGITSYWYSSRLPVIYQSRARYLIGPALDNPNVTTNDLRASTQIGQTYDSLVTSRPVAQSVIDKLKLDTDPDTLASQVNGTWIDTTQILSIRANANDPIVAANIANAIGDVLIERSPSGPSSKQVQRRQDAEAQILRLQETIRSIQAEIDQLINQLQQTTEATSQRALIVRLDERRSQLAAAQRSYSDLSQLLQTSDVNKITLVEAAVPVTTPIAPDIQRNVLAAVIAGLVLGLAAMMLLEYSTDVIYTPEMLRKVTGLTYLGGLARHKKLRGSDGMQLVTLASPETLAAESFRILRTNLQIAGTDRHLPSLLITSPSRGDGKTDIAANLAVVLARAEKQVILIDANLRRPQIATMFGLPEQEGLSSLLSNIDRMPEPIPVPSVPGLAIVPAGGQALNSSEILGSQRMYRLIQECKARADVVLIDSAPLWYSDALGLAPQVDGVLLVVSSGSTGRENTINAIESLRLVGARVIGTVLNRVKAGPAYLYYPTFAAKRMDLDVPALPGRERNLPALGSGQREPLESDLSDSSIVRRLQGGSGPAVAPAQPASPSVGEVTAMDAEAKEDLDISNPYAAASARAEEPSDRATMVLDTSSFEAASEPAASADVAVQSDELVQIDEAGWDSAAEEPVAFYAKVEGEDSTDTDLFNHTNGHLSSAQGSKIRIRPGRNKNSR
ncbi:MAG: polysaccharide biosynthesis tyrosine autokinase [Kouleothrix sp.]|nr:polysaccharide biosynthesis tyrosine autokinase [Kouleothrix sp.]